MLLYFAENPEATIYVHVNAFSDNVRTVIETTQVTHKNVNDIIEKIKKIRPQNSTNLELALKTAKQTMHDHLLSTTNNNQSTHRIVHVLLTDGHPTAGNTFQPSLVSLVDDTFSNIFIAFGLDHNPSLMNKLGNAGKNTTNYLVTKLELIGHSSDDTTTNTTDPKTDPKTEEIIVDVDLIKHIFRLCTQRLLYEARQYANENGNSDDNDLTPLRPPILKRSYAMRSHAFSNYDNNIEIRQS